VAAVQAAVAMTMSNGVFMRLRKLRGPRPRAQGA